MDKKAIAERLRALASDDNKRSKAARLRDVIDDVEFALAAGVTRSSVLEELAAHGFEMTLATFVQPWKGFVRNAIKRQLLRLSQLASLKASQQTHAKPRQLRK